MGPLVTLIVGVSGSSCCAMEAVPWRDSRPSQTCRPLLGLPLTWMLVEGVSVGADSVPVALHSEALGSTKAQPISLEVVQIV